MPATETGQDPADSSLLENRLPTATEVFDLRSKCNALGEKIPQEDVIGSALVHDQLSHYSPQSNRCYVKIEVNTADLSTPLDRGIHKKYLYDGQTKELLAATNWGLQTAGYVYSDSVKKLLPNPVTPKYEDVSDLINKFMAEDRKP